MVRELNKLLTLKTKDMTKQEYIDKHCVTGEPDLLRHLVNWMDTRPEYLNEGKTVNQLIKEFLNQN